MVQVASEVAVLARPLLKRPSDNMAGRAAAILATQRAPELGGGSLVPQQGHDQGQGLRRYLISRYRAGNMYASTVCTLAWHARNAGAAGVADLACDPGSTHQAEHLRTALGDVEETSFYTAKIPMWDHVQEERHHVDFPFDLPYERFAAEYEKKPESFQVDLCPDPAEMPPVYFDHTVYKDKGSKACPVGYFSDGVPHTKKDSFFAFYWSNMLTEDRYNICTLRKSDLCRCGCKGLCTLEAVQSVIAWAFQILASGKYPSFRHDGKPFAEERRANLRGMDLANGYCGALCEMRADLEEFSNSCGFKRSSHVHQRSKMCQVPQ